MPGSSRHSEQLCEALIHSFSNLIQRAKAIYGYYALLMRVGIGYDSHPFAAGRKLILGGCRKSPMPKASPVTPTPTPSPTP